MQPFCAFQGKGIKTMLIKGVEISCRSFPARETGLMAIAVVGPKAEVTCANGRLGFHVQVSHRMQIVLLGDGAIEISIAVRY
jgi:hypothetical protein